MKFFKLVLLFAVALAITSCSTMSNLDAIVRQATSEINSLDPHKEHGTFFYCSQGDCWYPEILTGEAWSIDLGPALITEHYPFLVGSIHSHPKSTEHSPEDNALLDAINITPSPTDWGSGAAVSRDFAELPFTVYIIGPDDVVRAYPLPTFK